MRENATGNHCLREAQNRRENARAAGRERRRRRRSRMTFAVVLVVCCMTAFSCGKIVGKAQKRAGELRQEGANTDDSGKGVDGSGTGSLGADGFGTGDGMRGGSKIGSPGSETAGGADILILVNREHPLPEDYEVELVTFENGVTQGARAAYDSLCRMLRAGIREGLTFKICSAYRSVERQRELFEEDVNALVARGYSYEDAYREVSKETMPPGYSEHATGLAFDIVSCDNQKLDGTQVNTAENKWLREHCAEYGFILRYPKDKEDVTGIRYESWHFRYVGEEAAKEITERGITLEEYLDKEIF